MYTRCPGCHSTFRVTAALLQMADGDVRCGSCGVVFNALRTLVDDGDEPTHAPPPQPAPRFAPENPEAGEETLEFDAPEHDWQRFFIPPDEPAPLPRPEPELGGDFDAQEAAPVAASEGEPAAEDAMAARSLEEETADTDTWKTFLREADAETEAESDADEGDSPLWVISEDEYAEGPVESLVRSGKEAPADQPPVFELHDATEETPEEEIETEERNSQGTAGVESPVSGTPAAAAGDGSAGSLAAPLAQPETILDWGPPPAFTRVEPREPRHTARWLAASAVAALVLAGQVLHHDRDRLAAHPQYGQAIRATYARLGRPVYPDWPLDAYQIRGVKAIAENSAPGALDVVAEIAITGSQPVGLPLVRIVLRDRWSNPVASGVFRATEYLAGAPSATGMYTPGALIPVEIRLPDPGSTAQGYEVDVCLPNRRLGLQCKTARDPYRR